MTAGNAGLQTGTAARSAAVPRIDPAFYSVIRAWHFLLPSPSHLPRATPDAEANVPKPRGRE